MLFGVTSMKQQYRLLTTPKSKVTCNTGLICPALSLNLTAKGECWTNLVQRLPAALVINLVQKPKSSTRIADNPALRGRHHEAEVPNAYYPKEHG